MSTEIAIRKQLHDTIAGQDETDFRAHAQSRSWGYVNDQQNGSYSNQISFDLTSLVSQNGFMALSEGYVLAPYSVKLVASVAQTAQIPITAVSLKDSMYSNFIDSVQLFVNNKQLIDQTNFSNFAIQIMDKLTMSSANVSNGSAGVVAPDTTTSITLHTGASTSGDGVCNNYVCGDDTVAKELLRNKGLEKRLTMFGNSTGSPNSALTPYFDNDNDANNTGTAKKAGTWNFVVCVPLDRISDLLDKYPLVKGSQIRFVINFNAGVTTSTFVDSGKTLALASTPVMTAGSTFPAMFLNTDKAGLGGANADITLTCGIQTSTVAHVDNSTPAAGYPALPQCRLFVPTYVVNPTYEERILANRSQIVRYMDWYQQPMNAITNSTAWSQTLTTALPNVKLLIGIPFLNTASGVFASAHGTPQYQSPFDSAPATTYPNLMTAFTNFNVQVNGLNILSQNANFGFDIFAQQVQKLCLNGGLVKELASGLIDKTTWDHSPFIVVDISDRSESAHDTYQSVTVQGTNASGKTVNVQWFIAFEKVVKFDCITGDVEKIFG